MVQDKLRLTFGDYLGKGEVAIYSILALLLSITALTAIATAGKQLWDSVSHWTMATPPETLRVLDQLLVVLMLVGPFSITLLRRHAATQTTSQVGFECEKFRVDAPSETIRRDDCELHGA